MRRFFLRLIQSTRSVGFRRRHFKYVVMLVVGALIFFAASISPSLTDTNVVEPSSLTDQQQPVAPNDLKPGECTGLNVQAVVTVTDNSPAPDGGVLVLSDNTASMTGGGGDDCLVGSQNTTHIDGGGGQNVCLGNALTVFVRCQTHYP